MCAGKFGACVDPMESLEMVALRSRQQQLRATLALFLALPFVQLSTRSFAQEVQDSAPAANPSMPEHSLGFDYPAPQFQWYFRTEGIALKRQDQGAGVAPGCRNLSTAAGCGPVQGHPSLFFRDNRYDDGRAFHPLRRRNAVRHRPHFRRVAGIRGVFRFLARAAQRGGQRLRSNAGEPEPKRVDGSLCHRVPVFSVHGIRAALH